MTDELIQAIETYLRSRQMVVSTNQCIGCGLVLDGKRHLVVDRINPDDTATSTRVRVCSWLCMHELAEALTAE